VAVFLGIGGLFLGLIFSPGSAVGQETRAFGASTLISQAQGAEIDSAALVVKSTPFLASADDVANIASVHNIDALYEEGALRDPGEPLKMIAQSPADQSAKKPLIYGVIYQIAVGDTLDSIASAFNVPKSKIVQFNPSVNFSALDPGISIIIPGQKDVNAFSGQS
jgi:LysM repeat protein